MSWQSDLAGGDRDCSPLRADALNKGLDKLKSSRIVPKLVFSSLYTFGNRCARDDDNVNRLTEHHSSKIDEYLT